ncbi:allophanate hydrolase [Desertibaculum subflavum]|uniref:allophanate hydrolase n=1 Tax=Desertibaculum subflavum TaxID=2268458 RepID=UPI000E666CD2
MSTGLPPLDLIRLSEAYKAGGLAPLRLVEAILADIAARGQDGVWISLVDADRLRARAADLARRGPDGLPLYGVPFAVKDNIDVAGCATTAACPGFAYRPDRSANVVARLEAAGAIAIGKTNLDQFATGLVGTRSPYGTARNPFDPARVPGGSSSGSAVAVAQGQVSFALGTDTAGSGRVPAGFNNIIGLKPSRGLIGCSGVVPACRSLDCVSIFALTAGDAGFVLHHAAGEDAADPYGRFGPALGPPMAVPRFRFGVPKPGQREFFGDSAYASAFDEALAGLAGMGGTPIEIDLAPFLEAAALLYDGPWVAERWAAVGSFVAERPDDVLAVTRGIISGGRERTAREAFEGQYRLEALRRRTAPVWREVDVLVVPTAARHFTLAEIAAEPVRRNGELGRYTNFVNLLDLCALAVPAALVDGGRPFGITLIAPALHDHYLISLGNLWQRARALPLGATGRALPAHAPPQPKAQGIEIAVVGAHLAGEPLNHQLAGAGARLLREVATKPIYKLYALPGGPPERPGMVKVGAKDQEAGGTAIAVEVWDMPADKLGPFIAGVPAPLSIGRIDLADGSTPLGFLCESVGLKDATDISSFGGWRAYRRAMAAA